MNWKSLSAPNMICMSKADEMREWLTCNIFSPLINNIKLSTSLKKSIQEVKSQFSLCDTPIDIIEYYLNIILCKGKGSLIYKELTENNLQTFESKFNEFKERFEEEWK